LTCDKSHYYEPGLPIILLLTEHYVDICIFYSNPRLIIKFTLC